MSAEPRAAGPAPHDPDLAHQFDDLRQQHSAATLGMWLFLATEVLFFGGLFCAYAVLRSLPQFADAFVEGSKKLSLPLGTANTVVLLTSSLTMALGVRAAQLGRRSLAPWLALTLLLGAAFLGIKAYEWYTDYEEGLVPGFAWHPAEWEQSHDESARPAVAPKADPRQVEMFFVMYFVMTGLHGLHMLVGFGILTFLIVQSLRHRYGPRYFTPVEVAGLYWHFVDIIWIFLFPLLYLIRH